MEEDLLVSNSFWILEQKHNKGIYASQMATDVPFVMVRIPSFISYFVTYHKGNTTCATSGAD